MSLSLDPIEKNYLRYKYRSIEVSMMLIVVSCDSYELNLFFAVVAVPARSEIAHSTIAGNAINTCTANIIECIDIEQALHANIDLETKLKGSNHLVEHDLICVSQGVGREGLIQQQNDTRKALT